MTKPPNAKAYQRARKAIQQSREAIETLLDQTPMDDHRSSRTVVHKTVALMGPPRRRVTPTESRLAQSRLTGHAGRSPHRSFPPNQSRP